MWITYVNISNSYYEVISWSIISRNTVTIIRNIRVRWLYHKSHYKHNLEHEIGPPRIITWQVGDVSTRPEEIGGIATLGL